jgi:hypothetical protein
MLKNFSLTKAIIKITGSTKTTFYLTCVIPSLRAAFSGHTLSLIKSLNHLKINPAFNAGWSLKLWCLREPSKVLQRTLAACALCESIFLTKHSQPHAALCVFIQSDKRDCVCVPLFFMPTLLSF